MSDSFTRLELRDWRQFRRVELEFHKHLTVITGANGAGKTTLLNLLGRHFGWNIAFIATSRLTRKGVYSYFAGFREDDESLQQQPHRDIGSVHYLSGARSAIQVPQAVTESFDVGIPNQQSVDGVFLPSHRPVYTYRRVDQIPTKIDARDQIFEQYYQNLRQLYLPQTRTESPSYRLKASLISLATFGFGNQVVEPDPEAVATFQGFEKVLQAVLPPKLGFRRLAIRLPDVVLECTSGDFSLDAASGGIAALIDVSWQLYMKSLLSPSFVAVFDEPENHLHPELQRRILPGLIKAFPGIQFIVATHNPFVVTSVEDSNVYVLDYVGDRVESTSLDDVDRSASANKVLTDVLGVPVPVPIWVQDRLDAIVDKYEARELTTETLQDLKREMEALGLGHMFPDAIGRIMEDGRR